MSEQDNFYNIINNIVSELGPILSTRPYIAIVDFQGQFRYTMPEIEEFSPFITDFVKSNFTLLKIGDHSMPISGTNLAFFKISKKALIVIYIKKGLLGQLLFFKPQMLNYQLKIDALIPEEPPEAPILAADLLGGQVPVAQVPKEPATPKAQVIPVLLKKIGKKAKFPLQEVVILNYCNGKNCINTIMQESNIEKKELWEILDKYKKKGWLKITYTGNPEFIPVLTKEIPPMAVQLGVVNKKEFEVSKLCDGVNTIKDIQHALAIPPEEIDTIIDKMEKNSVIHLEIRE